MQRIVSLKPNVTLLLDTSIRAAVHHKMSAFGGVIEGLLRKVAIAILLSVVAAPAFADCVVDPWRIPYLGSNVTAYVGAHAGESCQIPVYVGGTSMIQSITISAAPGQGTATVGQGDIVWYQPNPGFVGQDTFAFVVTGSGPGSSGSSTVQVSISVR